MKANLVTIARKFGVTPKTVHEWVKDGCPRNEDKTFDVQKMILWRKAKIGAALKDPAVTTAAKKTALQMKHLMLKCEKLELELKRDEKLLVPLSDITKTFGRMIQTLKDKMAESEVSTAESCAGVDPRDGAMLVRERDRKILESMSLGEWLNDNASPRHKPSP